MFFFAFNGTGTPSISYRRNCRATWPLNNKRGELHCRKMGILDRINELWPVPVSTVCPCKYFDQGVDSTRTINRSDEIKEEPMDCKDIDVLEAPESVLIAPKVESLLEVQKSEPLDIENVAKTEPETPSEVEIMKVDEEPLKSEEVDEEPLKSEEVDEEPLKSEEVDEEPLKSEEVNEEPLKSEEVDEEPLKSEEVDEEPLKSEEVDEEPLKSEEADVTEPNSTISDN